MITIGSLFSGIGGLERGLEQVGLGPVLFQVEIDPFCRAVLAKHWPHVTRFNDVTEANVYPKVDLLCGGFPCQDVSVAGKGAGLQGARSGLWSHFKRVIDELKPRFVVVENVAHGRGRWLPTVRRDLCVLGYRVRAVQVSAAECGAPHLRRRVFVVAYSERQPLRQQPERQSTRQPYRVRRQGQTVVVDPCAARGWLSLPSICRSDDGVPRGMDGDRLRALGNAVVPQAAQVPGNMILELLNGER